ncbi:hypothetical protein [uncultured Thiodictyon sp.]|jgi:hypothetical protein|uniref:ribonuclease toxin HepT-like protein n=1 Tax=uncultured Thiodictyon sp. TaxID=1846217 RepID=UPI0025FA2D5F|nr:hypothetical protein [uncultured Thiodictyon sp.]
MARTPELLGADFRGFRHVFRNCYTFELDWERERLVASRLRRAAALLHEQVNDFLVGIEPDPTASRLSS